MIDLQLDDEVTAVVPGGAACAVARVLYVSSARDWAQVRFADGPMYPNTFINERDEDVTWTRGGDDTAMAKMLLLRSAG